MPPPPPRRRRATAAKPRRAGRRTHISATSSSEAISGALRIGGRRARQLGDAGLYARDAHLDG